MMQFEYECPDCGHRIQIYIGAEEHNNSVYCPSCGSKMMRISYDHPYIFEDDNGYSNEDE